MKRSPLYIERDNRTDEFLTRYAAVSGAVSGKPPETLDEAARSVEIVIATETPSKVFDPERWEVVNEVLLSKGAQFPKENKIPLTVDHERNAGAVLGSVRELRVEGRQVIGRAYFSQAPDADNYWTKVKEGHLDRFSVVYPADSRKSVWIGKGSTSEIEGKTYKGPLLVTKSWSPKAVGLVLFPADENAKARHEPQLKEKIEMNKKLRKWLERRGLASDATDADAWKFFKEIDQDEVDLFFQRQAVNEEPVESKKKTPPIDLDAERSEAARLERGRVTEISAMCRHWGYPEADAQKLIDSGAGEDAARQAVMGWLDKQREPETPPVRPSILIAAGEDKFRAAAADALVVRAGLAGFDVEKPASGYDELTGFSLRALAREALRVAGRPFGGDVREMVGRALTDSDLPLILSNVANKALFSGWDTASETWPVWCATGSVSDFKTHSSMRLSEASDLDELPGGNGPYKYGEVTEAQEQYSITTYGKMFAITRHAIINDDLNALTGIPMAHGESAARVIGDIAYAVLTANAAMGDGNALFDATNHGNYVSSGAVPGVTTLAAAILAMKTQKDLQGLRRLNIRPEYFIAPAALEGTSEVFFRSERFVDSDTVATDSSLAGTRVNPYAGNYFTRVYEPRLDDDDAAQWYLAAQKGKTVTVFFLNGQQRPYLESKQGWSVDGIEHKVRIDAGAKALDWRGLYCNAGD